MRDESDRVLMNLRDNEMFSKEMYCVRSKRTTWNDSDGCRWGCSTVTGKEELKKRRSEYFEGKS